MTKKPNPAAQAQSLLDIIEGYSFDDLPIRKEILRLGLDKRAKFEHIRWTSPTEENRFRRIEISIVAYFETDVKK